MYAGKPIIGVSGGIGSGKTFVAHLFGELGCVVVESDQLVKEAYADPRVRQTLRLWWGAAVVPMKGDVNRAAISRRVFERPEERKRLEQLLHPIVDDLRHRIMQKSSTAQAFPAYVWDTPLLHETGLNRRCDAVVFVEAPPEVRNQRVLTRRGWSADETDRREKIQMPLDKKREIADHIILNTSDADDARGQVREVLSKILARFAPQSTP